MNINVLQPTDDWLMHLISHTNTCFLSSCRCKTHTRRSKEEEVRSYDWNKVKTALGAANCRVLIVAGLIFLVDAVCVCWGKRRYVYCSCLKWNYFVCYDLYVKSLCLHLSLSRVNPTDQDQDRSFFTELLIKISTKSESYQLIQLNHFHQIQTTRGKHHN